MLSQRQKQQVSEQQKVNKYLKLTQSYDGRFQSIKMFKLKNIGKGQNKKQHVRDEGNFRSLRSLTQQAEQRQLLAPLMTKRSNLLSQIRKEINILAINKNQNQKFQTDRIHHYMKDCLEKNNSQLQSQVQKKDLFQLLKANLGRKRICQYRWGSSVPSKSENSRNLFRNDHLFSQVRKLQRQKNDVNQYSKINQAKNLRFQSAKQILCKSPQKQFYQKAKQTIKQKIKHKILTKRTLRTQSHIQRTPQKILKIKTHITQSKDPQVTIIKHETLKIQVLQKDQFLLKSFTYKTPKYSEQDLNQFLYEAIDSQLQVDKCSRNKINRHMEEKVALKFKKLRQSQNKLQPLRLRNKQQVGFQFQQIKDQKTQSNQRQYASYRRHLTVDF